MRDIGKNARVVLALVVLAGGMAFAGTAEASHPEGNKHCGDVITGTVVLTGPVVDANTGGPCTDDGLIMSSNATLDLNGQKILGATAESQPTPANPNVDDAGILFNGVTGATVTDSTATSASGSCVSTNQVSGFDAGIAIIGGSGNRVEKVNVVANVGTDADYGEGIHVRNSSTNTLFCNNLEENGSFGAITLIDNSDGNVVDKNIVAANSVLLDFGIRLEASTATAPCPDSNVISNNTLGGNTVDGITILNGKACDSTGNTLFRNTITGHARDGIRLNARFFVDLGVCRGALNTTVEANTSSVNGGAGIKATNCVRGSTISANIAVGNNPDVAGTVGSPLLPPHGDLHDDNVNCGSNTWTSNTHVTEFARAGSSTSSTNPLDFDCLK